MSEKRVNIKITASTSDFNNAIQKAQKQIEGLAEALDKLGTGNIGNKLADQLSEIAKGSKEVVGQIDDIKNSFNSLNNTKLDIKDGLEDVGKSGEKLNKILDNTADNISDINNIKMNGFSNKVNDIVKSMEKINDGSIYDMSRPFDEMGKIYKNAQSTLEKLTKSYEKAADKQKELGDAYEQSKASLKVFTDEEEQLTDAYNKATKAVEDHKQAMAELAVPISDYESKLSEANEKIREQENILAGVSREYDDVSNQVLELGRSYDSLNNDLQDAIRTFNDIHRSGMSEGLDEARERCISLGREAVELENRLNELRNTQSELSDRKIFEQEQLDNLIRAKEALEQLRNELETQRNASGSVEEAYSRMEQELVRLENRANEAKEALDNFWKEFGNDKAAYELAEQMDKIKFDKAAADAKLLNDQMKQMNDVMSRVNKEAQGHADTFDSQYKAYEKLCQEVEAYINDESKAILLREQVAKSYQQVANAMEGVYKDTKKLKDMNQIDKVLKEAKEYLNDFNLVSLDNINEELDRFNKRLDSTIEKQKRYKAMSKEFGTDDGKKAYSLEQQAKALKDWADSADFVIEASDKLTKAWGNVNAAGEDNLKIRERSKYIDEYGKTLERNVAIIKSYYKEAQTLDEVYEKATSEQKAIIDDYKAWEKNKGALEEYNQAIRDYLSVVKESGGQIADRFKDDMGNFDVKKFIANYEKFGEANNVLKKSLEALKVKTLASAEDMIKNADANERAAMEARKNAKAVLEQAEAERKAAKTAEDRAAADEKVKKAKEALKKANEELADAIAKTSDSDKELLDNMDKLIKKYNEAAEAARKLGINMKDITKADISKLDGGGSFASLLDDMETFGNDLPKTFGDFQRQIKALFADMNGLDFGSVLDGLKDMGAGLLDKIPSKFKVAAAEAAAFITVLKKGAELGIDQFTRGMDTIGNALSKFTGLARSIGTEVRDAFENITGMHLDMSSLMEIPVQFESVMAQVRGITGASDADFARLTASAREWGATTRYSATEVGEAMTYMGMAGWDTQEILDGIGGVLNVATAGCMDLGKASDFVTDGLTAMQMSAKQANDFVDMLAGTIVNSNTGMSQLQRAYTNVGSLAGELTVPMSELNTALGLMADRGVKGAKAGTAMKNLFSFLAAPSDKQASVIKKYGLDEARDLILDGNLLSGIKAMQAQFEKLNLAPKDKNGIISTIFGREALPGMAALFSSTTENIDSLQFKIESSTKAGRTFAESLGLVDKNGKMAANSIEELKKNNGENYDKWVKFNDILKATTKEMDDAGGTTDELGAIIQRLGDDGSVTAEQVSDVIDVFAKLDERGFDVQEALNGIGAEMITTDDGAMNLGETLKNLGGVWDNLTDAQKKHFAEQLGLTDSLDELNELFGNNGEQIEGLIDKYDKATGAAQTLAEAYDNTLKGSLLNLASAMEEQLLQIFDKVGPKVRDVIDQFTEFFNIWNNMGQSKENAGLSGLSGALEYLEKTSRGWGEAIKNGLSQAISSINDFVNSASFDNLLQVGTNIIDGIANGIREAAGNGTLDSAITTAIDKIATWFSNNLDTLVEAGSKIMDSISKGISENGDTIGQAIRSVMEMQASIDAAVAGEKWRLIGENLATFIVQGFKGKATELFSGIGGFISGLFTGNGGINMPDKDKGNYQNWTYTDPISGNTYGPGVKYGQEFSNGMQDGVTQKQPELNEKINSNFQNVKTQTDMTASEIGQGISDNIMAKLETMDASGLQALSTELQNLQTNVGLVATAMATSFTQIQDASRVSFTGLANIVNNQMTNVANSIRTQMVNCANIFRNQFLSMANVARNQMVNVSNIVRNQAVSWSNVIRNQVTNARNALTSQFLSMAAVARTQMVNISNIVRNQATAWANIIRNQGNNAKAALTSSFAGMAAAAASGMAKVLSTVRSYMSQVVAATNRTMTLNFKVNRSITTTNTVRTVAAPAAASAMYAANAASTFSLRSGDVSTLASRASSAITTSSSKGAVSSNNNDGITLEIPLILDGKEVARSTAKYVDGELKIKQKRDDRKRGVK